MLRLLDTCIGAVGSDQPMKDICRKEEGRRRRRKAKKNLKKKEHD
jgi:hypothetical protein